jgi:DNA-binding transcriptional MocR family regulator
MTNRISSIWIPNLEGEAPTLSGKLVTALGRDIASGKLAPGTRLPTHRDLAQQLGIGIGTVTSAYAAAAQQGLIEARVGSGSFVASSARVGADAGGVIALSHNVPPLEPAERRFATSVSRLRARADLLDTLDYAPPAGLAAHRHAGAAWLRRHGRPDGVAEERLIVTSGTQQALALALQALCRPGDTVLVEAATFFGAKTLAHHVGYRFQGLAMDDEGLEPEALDRAAASGARVLYTIPTLQNPTGRIMSVSRRREIAAIAQRRDLWIIEDDVYGAFGGDGIVPLAALAPDRTLYLSGLSKTVAPGLRTGFLVTPNAALFDWLTHAIRALSYSPPTIGSLVATQWIEDGTADAIAGEIGTELRIRTALARTMLGDRVAAAGDDRCPHLWLPMTELEAERLVARALHAGVQLTPAGAPIVDPTMICGVRLCVGAPRSRTNFETALARIGPAFDRGMTDFDIV